MQNFESESLPIGGDHSQKVKAPPIGSDYGSKDCVNLSSPTAVSRFKIQEGHQAMCWLYDGTVESQERWAHPAWEAK